MLTKLFFVLPMLFIALVVLYVLLFGEKSGPSYRTEGECSIPGVAEGVILKRSEKVRGQLVVEASCSLDFLPGSWQPHLIDSYWNCAPSGTSERGHKRKIRTPGAWGLSRPEIEVCSVSRPVSARAP